LLDCDAARRGAAGDTKKFAVQRYEKVIHRGQHAVLIKHNQKTATRRFSQTGAPFNDDLSCLIDYAKIS